jgi:hypothetical protein
VVGVIAAGNSNKEKLEERILQSMGTDSNSIITVGGGSLTVFAQSENLEMDVPFVGVRKVHGTSYSAPAVVSFRKFQTLTMSFGIVPI